MPAPDGFIKLPRSLVLSEAWQGLSVVARAILLDLWAQHNGKNNGQIRYSIKQAQKAGQCCRRTAIAKLQELQRACMLEAVERGGLRWNGPDGPPEGRPTSWRIIPETGSKGPPKTKGEGAK